MGTVCAAAKSPHAIHFGHFDGISSGHKNVRGANLAPRTVSLTYRIL